MAEDSFHHAEIAVVLSGEPLSRALAARDLYRQGRIDQILIIPEPASPLDEQLIRLKLKKPQEPPWSQKILLASGVPGSKIAFLPNPADGTIAEALLVRRFLQGKVPAHLVLVTGKSSSRRAAFIFRGIFRRQGAEVLSFPSPYDSFQSKGWWRNPRNALQVVTEYEKFLVNILSLLTMGFVLR